MATGTPVTYQVTAVIPETQYNTQGSPVTGKTVRYSTSLGYEGSVFVPDTVFSDLPAVRALIEGEVRMVAVAQALTGTVG